MKFSTLSPQVIRRFSSRLHDKVLYQIAGLAMFIASSPFLSWAKDVGDPLSMDSQWPWTKFFTSLAKQLSGPLPMTLGILGIAGAAIAMFSGNHGAGTQKFIILIFAIAICLFAPNFVDFIQTSAGGLTITGR